MQAMVCIPDKIRVRLSTASYHRCYGGFQSAAGWAKHCVECYVCWLDFLASSLQSHLANVHGVFQADVIDKEYLESRPECVLGALQSVDGKF